MFWSKLSPNPMRAPSCPARRALGGGVVVPAQKAVSAVLVRRSWSDGGLVELEEIPVAEGVEAHLGRRLVNVAEPAAELEPVVGMEGEHRAQRIAGKWDGGVMGEGVGEEVVVAEAVVVHEVADVELADAQDELVVEEPLVERQPHHKDVGAAGPRTGWC